jgi:hypothetical protein
LPERCRRLRDLFPNLTTSATSRTGKGYWKTIGSVAKEKQILNVFEKLEKDKSALALCIANIDASVEGIFACNFSLNADIT